MSRYRPDPGVRTAILALLCSVMAVTVSCGLVDLHPLAVTSVPERANSLLPALDSALCLRFSSPMERASVEDSLSIIAAGEDVEVRLSWEGTTLLVKPAGFWEPCLRHVLSLSGSMTSLDGQVLEADLYLPFFALSADSPPCLLSFLPENGASAGVSPVLCFAFSEAMDRASVEACFSLEPPSAVSWTWSPDACSAEVEARSALSPCESYTWRLGASARSLSGACFRAGESGEFCTDADREAPSVEGVSVLRYEAGGWTPSSHSLEEMEAGEGISVRFSEAMDAESLLRSVSIEPSVEARVELLSSTLALCLPSSLPSGSECCLCVDMGATDRSGLSLAAVYRLLFTSAARSLTVRDLDTGLANLGSPPSSPALCIRVEGEEGRVSLLLCFSAPFTAAARAHCLEKLRFEGFFPASLGNPELAEASWPSSASLLLVWEGLESGTAEVPHYYQLALEGGSGGIENGEGLLLVEDLSFYLEAVE